MHSPPQTYAADGQISFIPPHHQRGRTGLSERTRGTVPILFFFMEINGSGTHNTQKTAYVRDLHGSIGGWVNYYRLR